MALNIQFAPIMQWPGKFTISRANGPFTATFDDTRKMLLRELGHLNARNVVVQLALQSTGFRRDGFPYADANPSHPGVVVSFDSKYGPLTFSWDYLRKWHHNLRAIAYHLEHLRQSQLYGVGKSGEPYRGYAALPPPPPPSASGPAPVHNEEEDAATVVILAAGMKATPHNIQVMRTNPDEAKKAYREAVKRTHPDTTGSVNSAAFRAVQAAKECLATLKD